ncbi:lipase family alpha/beta hydrolase [Blastococcus xanthinilyticus]|uniref:Triacylglycerol esterase/lipase EstA (Alpha/beta hydrolase family) n=1 Tax=Blastococcus xanthinilyticus TaxID=1564164 RepID=A0A5S5D137_9ACTN|nr:alpha/beta fold hydrolase [Blastococcus xanthinilyticus]TYP88349.1 triacylglycerol esterase/lipase EstA (alpha/beta hydrolase family) [Blastococcus xanthinilyticus]
MPTAVRRRVLLILLAGALLGAVALAGGLLVGGDRPAASVAGPAAAPPAAVEPPGPVLLVPGYGGNTALLEPLAERLRGTGRDASVVALPGNGTGDLRASAAALDAAVSAALARTGGGSVDVVGYSAGGLVARLWVADGHADVARRVLTLGAPHHGTDLAQLGARLAPDRCPDGCRQMLPDSELLTGLNADETPDGVDWVSVWSAQDRVVTPPDSARLEGALNLTVQSVCAGRAVSHQELPGDPVVQGIVDAQLGAGEPVELTADDCTRLGG